MIDFESNTIIQGGVHYGIEKWEVWFQTPFGLCRTLVEATQKLRSVDMDPNTILCPVPVAVACDSDIYEVVVRM